MKKWIALLLALVTVTLCGCGALNMGGETTAPAPAQTTAPIETTQPDLQIVELSAWVVSDIAWQDAAAVEALLTEFNAYYPNIVVNVEWKTAAELGSAKPDIVLADAEQIAAWYETGAMADLSELWASGLSGDVYEGVEAVCGGESGYHTVPMCVIPYCMAVNQAVLEEADALQYLNTSSHTWNAANFLRVVQAVYDAGMDTVASVYCKDTGEDVFTRLLVTNLYGGSFANGKSGYYDVYSEENVKSLTALRDQDGIVVDGGLDADAAREQFLNGETAFVFNWSSALQLQNMTNSNILFMAYPSSDSIPELYAETIGFGVFDNGDAVKAAASKTFVAFMSVNDSAIRATGNLSARASGEDAYEDTEQKAAIKELTKLLKYLTVEDRDLKHWDTAREAWRDLLQSLNGEETAAYYVQGCQASLDALFPELAPATTTPEETE